MSDARNKYTTLISNTIIFALGTFGSKLLVFLLMPLYTSVLTTAEYGAMDVVVNVSNMLLPLVLCLAGCWWAVEHWGWPEWLFLPAVGLGLAAGAQNFWVFVKERLDRSKKDKPRRTGFNSHL